MKNFRAPATLLVLTICMASTAQTQKDTTVVLKEAKVSAAKKYRVPKAGTGFIELSSAIVSETPSFLGESDLMKTLPKDRFVRVQKSYIVQLSKIEAIERSHIVIGKDRIPIGETYQEALLNALSGNSILPQ